MTTLPPEAYQDVSSFEAKLGMVGQTKDGMWRIPLLVQPGDVPVWFMNTVPGQHLAIGLKVVMHDGSLAESQQETMVRQAGMLCREEHFRIFLAKYAKYNGVATPGELATEDDAAVILRDVLGVQSRADLKSNNAARASFKRLVLAFERWGKSSAP